MKARVERWRWEEGRLVWVVWKDWGEWCEVLARGQVGGSGVPGNREPEFQEIVVQVRREVGKIEKELRVWGIEVPKAPGGGLEVRLEGRNGGWYVPLWSVQRVEKPWEKFRVSRVGVPPFRSSESSEELRGERK